MSRLLLLLGPTGVGKTSIIRLLPQLDSAYVYIPPLTTRPLREGESDKFHISEDELQRRNLLREFLVVNELYGAKYATPREPILDALNEGRIPVIDWPASRLKVMTDAFPNRVVACYVRPATLESLVEQLGQRGADELRVLEARLEWEKLVDGEFNQIADFFVTNHSGRVEEAAAEVHQGLMRRASGE